MRIFQKKMVEDENGFDGGKSDFFNDIKPKRGSDQIKKKTIRGNRIYRVKYRGSCVNPYN